MVRLHSPEADPEQFQKIRQAYERLKNAQNKPEGPVFPPLSDPNAIKMMQQIQTYRKEKNMTLYRDACQEAWDHFPDSLQFLYLLIMAQRRCKNTGKAVKNAELLVSKDPNNKWFRMALAFSYQERGYTQKAFSACEQAYRLGCRDIDFLILYADSCCSYFFYEKGVSVLLDVMRKDCRWSRADIPKLVSTYVTAMHINCYLCTDVLPEIIEYLHRFLSQYSIYTKEYMPRLTLLLANTCACVPYGSETFQYVDQIFDLALKSCHEKDDLEDIAAFIESYHYQRVEADSRIDDTLCSYLELFHDFSEYSEDDEPIQRFATLDLQLCMIQQRKDTLAQAAVLKQEHPQEYEKISDFIRQLENTDTLPQFKESLLKVYARLEPFITNGQYFELYPKEKQTAKKLLKSKDSDLKPYVRSTKKIGRNDPCPCGSGKKYKQCCMNK
ncbi:MAG: SEC-C domain-containing protein [Eubacterium sp.]|nr:SEC-C domain-containing protein [Eubacterium sp.]